MTVEPKRAWWFAYLRRVAKIRFKLRKERLRRLRRQKASNREGFSA